MGKNFPVRAPRRSIDKIVQFQRVNNAAGNTEVVLYTATEDKTLIRIVGYINIQQILANAGNNMGVALLYTQDNWDLASYPTIGDANSVLGREASAILWANALEGLAVAWLIPLSFHIDIKAMRKMEKGDNISILVNALIANVWQTALALTMFFKEK